MSSITATFLLCAGLSVATPAGAQPMPVTDIRYEVRADSASLRAGKFGVTTTFRVASAKPVRLALPAWLPGAYELARFARHVSNFSAESGGAPLAWSRVDPQTWEVTPTRAGTVRVSFDYAIDGIPHSNAKATADFAYFSGAPFLFPVGQGYAWPAQVSVLTEPAWNVATDLKPAHPSDSRTFVATDYHDLIDAPFAIGRFDFDSSRVGGRWLRFAAHPRGTMTPTRSEGTLRMFEALIHEDSTIFGDVPFKDYTVILLADSGTQGGGIEHLDSQVSAIQPRLVDHRDLRVIYSHELVHAWNVKRLRPREMTPYRYDAAQLTPLLWISEGMTEYYGVTTLARRVPADSSIMLEYLGRWLFMTDAMPPTALGDASVATWVDGPGVNYMKGPLAAFLIDVMIRDASDNARSLDDAVRQLYAETASGGKGFTRSEWWRAVARSAGGPQAAQRFEEFRRRHIDGRDPLPIDSVFALAGIHAEWRTVPDARRPGGTRKALRILPLPDASERAVRIRRSMVLQ